MDQDYAPINSEKTSQGSIIQPTDEDELVDIKNLSTHRNLLSTAAGSAANKSEQRRHM